MNIQAELARIAATHPAAAPAIDAVRRELDARADFESGELADLTTYVPPGSTRTRIIGTAHRIARLMKCPH